MTTAAGDPMIALAIEANVLFVVWAVLFVVKLFALCDAAIRKNPFYVAADKQSKLTWLVLLGVFLALHILLRDPRHVLNLVGSVIAFVYLADVRPALRSMQSP